MHNVTSNAVTPSGFSVTDRPLNGHNLETDTQKVSHLPLLLSSHWMEQSDKSAVCVSVCECVFLVRSGQGGSCAKYLRLKLRKRVRSPVETRRTTKQIQPPDRKLVIFQTWRN